MGGKRLKDKLQNGGRVHGVFLQYTTNPAIAEIFPDEGLDFVIVNAEHNALDLADFLGIQFALKGKGIACLARVHSRDPEDVAKACDAFEDGVVIPYAEDVEQLKRLVAAAKYRPLKGQALERVITKGEWPSEETRAYVETRCANTFFCAMIESTDAIANLDAICRIPGIDALLIGPNDMTVSLGKPEERDDPAFVEVIQRLIDTAERHGIAAGVHFSNPEHLQRLTKQGARFVPFGSDRRMIEAGLAELLSMVT